MFWLIPVEWGTPLGHSPWGWPGSQRSPSPLPLSTAARQTVSRYWSEFRRRFSVDEVERLVWSSSARHWYQLLPSSEILKQNRRNGYIMLDRSHTSDGCMIRWQSREFLNHRLYHDSAKFIYVWTHCLLAAATASNPYSGYQNGQYCQNQSNWTAPEVLQHSKHGELMTMAMHTCDSVHSAISD